MNKYFDELLWQIYYRSEGGIGPHGDARFFLVNDLLKDLHEFTAKQLKVAFRDLKREKFIQQKKDYEGSILISLSEKGMLRAINCGFRKLERKKEKWDGKWRFVAFDIPVCCTKGRKALVYRLKSGGFYEMQNSLFLHPYNCEKEIKAFANLFKIEKYIIFGLMESFDGQDKLIHHFKLRDREVKV